MPRCGWLRRKSERMDTGAYIRTDTGAYIRMDTGVHPYILDSDCHLCEGPLLL